MFVSQCSQVFSKRAGRIRVRPDARRGQRPRGQRLGPDEPLRLEARLDDVVAALAAADDHLVRLLADEVAACVEVRDDPLARLVAVEAA